MIGVVIAADHAEVRSGGHLPTKGELQTPAAPVGEDGAGHGRADPTEALRRTGGRPGSFEHGFGRPFPFEDGPAQ